MTDIARIVRTFVERPSEQRAYLGAWDLTVGLIAEYLRVWEHRGRRLPLSLFAGEHAHRDLAIEIVAELFMPEKATGGYPLVRFLRPHLGRCDEEFVEQYLAIIRKTARQNVHKLEQQTSPDAWKIRKNIRRCLRDSNGEYIDLSSGRALDWAWTKAQSPGRVGSPRVGETMLHTWVTAAAREQSKTPGQCRQVFTQLDADDRFRNALLFYPLVRSFVTVLLDYDPPQEVAPESPFMVRLRGLINSAAPCACEDTLNQDLPHLAKLAGLEPSEVGAVERAFRTWLGDWVEHLENDSLRDYLIEEIGDLPLDVYQKRFHYLWNTMTTKCKERILMQVRTRLGNRQ